MTSAGWWCVPETAAIVAYSMKGNILVGLSYLYFHLVFILPVIVAVRILLSKTSSPIYVFRWGRGGVVSLALIALVYTTPWDNFLVAMGIWYYGEGRVLEHLVIGYVPVEEYLFFILQPILTGTWLILLARRHPESAGFQFEALRKGRASVVGSLLFILVALGGWVAFFWGDDRFTYLGLILGWAAPVVAFQWAYGGGTLWRARQLLIPAVLGPTFYLWVVDGIAISWRIWEIHPGTSTGWKLMSLPFEEALFFLLTNMMVVQGLLLFFQWSRRLQLRRSGEVT